LCFSLSPTSTAQYSSLFLKPEHSVLIGSDGFDYLTSLTSDSDNNVILSGSVSYPLYYNPAGGGIPPLYEGPFYDINRDQFVEYPVNNSKSGLHYSGGQEIPITKFNAAGELVFSTYIGGNKSEETKDIVTDMDNNIYLAGSTQSKAFLGDIYHFNNSGTQTGMIVKLNSTGEIQNMITIGGESFDQITNMVLLENNSYLVLGRTNSMNFTTTGILNSQVRTNDTDIFVAKLTSSGEIIYSGVYGGSKAEDPSGLVVHNGRIYISGNTLSEDFKEVGVSQTPFPGGSDGFIMSMDLATGELLNATRFGGTSFDVINDIAVDQNGRVVVVGTTRSLNFPITPSTPGLDTKLNSNPSDELVTDGFYTIFDENLNLRLSSYLGGYYVDQAQVVQLDSANNIYIGGDTASADFPIHANLTRPPAFNNEVLDQQSEATRNRDIFLTKIRPNGRIAYSIFFGNYRDDYIGDLNLVERNNNVYARFCFYSRGIDAPTTADHLGGSKLVNSFYTELLIPPGAFDLLHYPGKDTTARDRFYLISGTLGVLGLMSYIVIRYRRKQAQKEVHEEYQVKYDLIKEAMKKH